MIEASSQHDAAVQVVEDNPIDHILEALCPKCGRVVDAVCPECGTNVECSGAGDYERKLYEAETARRLLLILQRCDDARFTLECYFMAIGAGFAAGLTMKDIARKFGRTRASVSKRCRELCQALNIPRSSYMRSEEAAERARLRNRRPKAMK